MPLLCPLVRHTFEYLSINPVFYYEMILSENFVMPKPGTWMISGRFH